MGSPILKDFIAPADSVMVERLRQAGAIIIGKTNTPEFGLGSHTYNPVYGQPANAYDQTRSAGGSSAARPSPWRCACCRLRTAATMAAVCAIPRAGTTCSGFEQAMDGVPADGRDAWLPSMGVLGPMARDVPDLAMLLAVQSGYDDRVPLSMDASASVFAGSLETNLKGKRIAWGADCDGYLPYEPGVLDICKQSLGVFEQLGLHRRRGDAGLIRSTKSGKPGSCCAPGRAAARFSPTTTILQAPVDQTRGSLRDRERPETVGL